MQVACILKGKYSLVLGDGGRAVSASGKTAGAPSGRGAAGAGSARRPQAVPGPAEEEEDGGCGRGRRRGGPGAPSPPSLAARSTRPLRAEQVTKGQCRPQGAARPASWRLRGPRSPKGRRTGGVAGGSRLTPPGSGPSPLPGLSLQGPPRPRRRRGDPCRDRQGLWRNKDRAWPAGPAGAGKGAARCGAREARQRSPDSGAPDRTPTPECGRALPSKRNLTCGTFLWAVHVCAPEGLI